MGVMGMKAVSRVVCTAAALALVGVLCQATRAEDLKSPPSPEALLKALAEAGQPGAEHKKLEPLVGNWNFTMKLWTDPSLSPAVLQGTVERKWIMDGRFVQETVHGQCATTGKSCDGLGLTGYSAAEKQFTCVRACSLCGTLTSSSVACDSSGKRFEGVKEETCPLTAQKVKARDELIIESNDRVVANFYKTMGGREVKFAEMVSIRQK
jgi:hypothetical protein